MEQLRLVENDSAPETVSGTVSWSIELNNRKLGGRFTIRNLFESVTDALRIGYLMVTDWVITADS
jgi:hypothetical protein